MFSIKSDFSDIEEFLVQGTTEVDNAIRDVGASAVEQAKARGNYHDDTGTLRSSNYYEYDGESLKIGNRAEYASNVEARGYEVVSTAALWAGEELRRRFNN